jgi:hypothetical protein
VTKVLGNLRELGIAVAICLAPAAWAATTTPETQPAKPAEALYLELSRVGLDPARVYHVRDASLDRSSIHITFEDGTIAFTQDVMGRITGAFFQGDGEVLLSPPNEVERNSMGLFTGMAILEERFATAYFRFNDDVPADLRPGLRAADNAQEFVSRWGDTARNLAQPDALRVLVTFSRLLPTADGEAASPEPPDSGQKPPFNDRMLHARVQGTKLGVFDLYFDSQAGEQIQAGQARTAENGNTYYDVWTSFSPPTSPSMASLLAGRSGSAGPAAADPAHEDRVVISRFTIKTKVMPPKQIHAEARLLVENRREGVRTLLFELSRFLQVESVEMDGKPVEFIHNPAVEGTQLARRGNDLVAVILPDPAHTGQKHELRFVYGGEVLAEAGGGLLYVGEHGTWYPNRGLVMADFDLEFQYPAGWTLVATGNSEPVSTSGKDADTTGEQISRWKSERPMPVAGFNLGKYKMATVKAGTVTVETYATPGVERDFPMAPEQVLQPNPQDVPLPQRPPQVIAPQNPSPARNALSVAETAARAIQFYADRYGPFPYSRLALTQMPGGDSQGWPGLVFLSSYAFLDDDERKVLRFSSYRALLQSQITPHETAHQWWGDLVTWTTYRDQWISEGLANYSAMMMLQEKDPAGFHEIMNTYRRELVGKDKTGLRPKDAGPVTLGSRLLSSRSPEGYDVISYGRSTWLFHMLRTMLQDGAVLQSGGTGRSGNGKDEPFVRALRKVRDRYQGKSISTRELLDVLAEDLPPALRYEGRNSLDWFVDGWVNGTSLPKLELRGVKFLPKNGGTLVSGTILQKDAPANLVTSVPVYGSSAGKRAVLIGRVFADGEESSFHVTAPAGISKIVLDPNEAILTSPK